MVVHIDSRESRPQIVALHTGPVDAEGKRPLLSYRLPESDSVYSYDVRLEFPSGALRGEIKQHGDGMQSWFDGKLTRQLEAVDFFILESDPFTIAGDAPAGEAAAEVYRRNCLNFEKHLAALSLQMPVIRSSGVGMTVEILRHLGATEGATKVRPNRVKAEAGSPRMAMLAALPGINPARRLPDGRTVGDAIWATISPPMLVEALNVESWTLIPGIGEAAVAKVIAALSGDPPE